MTQVDATSTKQASSQRKFSKDNSAKSERSGAAITEPAPSLEADTDGQDGYLTNGEFRPLTWRRIGVTFVATRNQACPYLDDRIERKLIAPITRSARSRFSDMNAAGFRRSNSFVYRPICSGCQACMAARVLVKDFQPSRTQRRIARKNARLQLDMAPAMATQEHYDLFRRYLDQRHFDGDMALMDEDDFAAMIEETSVRTNLFEWREPESERLVAACLVDHLDDGLSMVYSYYDPDYLERSLGVAMILSLIALLQKSGLEHLYLGYWVKGSRKMSYKQNYQPLEVYTEGFWQDLGSLVAD